MINFKKIIDKYIALIIIFYEYYYYIVKVSKSDTKSLCRYMNYADIRIIKHKIDL